MYIYNQRTDVYILECQLQNVVNLIFIYIEITRFIGVTFGINCMRSIEGNAEHEKTIKYNNLNNIDT